MNTGEFSTELPPQSACFVRVCVTNWRVSRVDEDGKMTGTMRTPNSIESDSQKGARRVSGRKTASESRAAQLRQALIRWRLTPESSRPSLRELARELDTSHQLLGHYLTDLEEWQLGERHRSAKEMAHKRAEEIRALANAENRQMTMRECLTTMVPGMLDKIDGIRQKAKRGRLHWAELKTLKIWAPQFPQAQEVLDKYSRSVLKRKSFTEIVKETPWQEGETCGAWVRRIWDQCEKYGTDCPTVINEELLEKCSQGKVPPEIHLSNLITRLEAMGGILLLDGDRILYFVPNKGAEGRALLAELWEHREGVKKLMVDFVRRYGAARYAKLKAKICQRIPLERLTPLDALEETNLQAGNSAKPREGGTRAFVRILDAKPG